MLYTVTLTMEKNIFKIGLYLFYLLHANVFLKIELNFANGGNVICGGIMTD